MATAPPGKGQDAAKEGRVGEAGAETTYPLRAGGYHEPAPAREKDTGSG